jgi:hypothetical protein
MSVQTTYMIHHIRVLLNMIMVPHSPAPRKCMMERRAWLTMLLSREHAPHNPSVRLNEPRPLQYLRKDGLPADQHNLDAFVFCELSFPLNFCTSNVARRTGFRRCTEAYVVGQDATAERRDSPNMLGMKEQNAFRGESLDKA